MRIIFPVQFNDSPQAVIFDSSPPNVHVHACVLENDTLLDVCSSRILLIELCIFLFPSVQDMRFYHMTMKLFRMRLGEYVLPRNWP